MTENTEDFNFKLSDGGADFGERFWDNPTWRRKILAFIIDADARLEEADTERTIELEPVPAMAAEAASTPGSGAGQSAPETPPATAPQVAAPSRSSSAHGDAKQINALGTVVPVLLRRYGPPLAILSIVMLIVIKIIRRKS